MKAIAAEQREPAIFKKSVKSGIMSETPVISQIITDLTTIFFSLLIILVPL